MPEFHPQVPAIHNSPMALGLLAGSEYGDRWCSSHHSAFTCTLVFLASTSKRRSSSAIGRLSWSRSSVPCFISIEIELGHGDNLILP